MTMLVFFVAALLAFHNAMAEIDATFGEELEQHPTQTRQPVPDANAKKAAAAAAALQKMGVVVRARVTRLTPEQPSSIVFRYGGEGLGGQSVTGDLTTELPPPPAAPDLAEDTLLSSEARDQAIKIDEMVNAPERPDRVVVQGKTVNKVYLYPGAWSKELPITIFGGAYFLTFSVAGQKSNVNGTELEFEFLYNGQLLKRFSVTGAKGNTMGVVVPSRRINKDGSPKSEFAKEVGSLKEYVQRKLRILKETPGMERPVPRLYAISTDCYGFAEGGGYAVRTSDPETFLAEFEILRFIGMNGTAGIPGLFYEKRKKKEGIAAEFSRLQQGGGGYPIMGMDFIRIAAGVLKPNPKIGQGCPSHPSQKIVQDQVAPNVENAFAASATIGVDQLWNRTVDEIGCLFDAAPEGKAHQGCCPDCREAFREFIRADGRTPADFGVTSWDDIRSMYGYWARTYWDSQAELSNTTKKAQVAYDATAGKTFASRLDQMNVADGTADETLAGEILNETLAPEQAYDAVREDLKAASERLNAVEWGGKVLEVPLSNRTCRLSREGTNLLWYYSARFNCEASARTFEPVRNAYDAINERKRAALARGETNTPAATQPWTYAFALRANTFLMSGHSLDFFNFYRHADTAFVYETSNRDWRVWPWDSYLCDVGRSLNRFMNKQFGIYVKAHRGAAIQRSLAAVARGVRMIYWYTYGPEYVKGDSFGGDMNRLKEIALVNRIIAGGEEVTYDADWAVPAEVAVVRPLTSEYKSGSASYENAKWVYTALMHAHIPMDALDEGLLMTEDLSRYKAIVISGCHIRRDVATKLAKWVEAGGTLVTSGWGMAEDEASRPLDILWPVFGLASRDKFDAWGSVPGYGGTRLGAVRKKREPPEGATVTGKGILKGSFMPVVGREILDPKQGEDVMASYGDGKAAVVRHRYGKGTAWVIGLHMGVEYAWEPMIFNNTDQKWYSADKRSWIAGPVLDAGVRPVVDAEGASSFIEDATFVEGHMLRNRKTGALAVILINWSARIKSPVTIKIREAGAMKSAKSVATGQTFPLERKGDLLVMTMPRLDDGDILLLTP